jgi:hypothetical protein
MSTERSRDEGRLTSGAALERFLRTGNAVGLPTLFLDLDDVVCLSNPYGGYDAFQTFNPRPGDLFERLWHPPAAEALRELVNEHQPKIVITSSWLIMSDQRAAFVELFRQTGLSAVAERMHDAWEAPADRGMTRLKAIERWLATHYRGEPLAVLDDNVSGTGLRGSRLDRAGCVVLCQQDVGLHRGHLPLVRRALTELPNARARSKA